jgi:hypothetical protein
MRSSGVAEFATAILMNLSTSEDFSLHRSIAPSLHHSITPSLHHSITPSLHHSITPSLHHSITPSLHPTRIRFCPLALRNAEKLATIPVR